MREDRSVRQLMHQKGGYATRAFRHNDVSTRSVSEGGSVHFIRSKLSVSSSNRLNNVSPWIGRYVNLSRETEVTAIAFTVVCSDKQTHKITFFRKTCSTY